MATVGNLFVNVRGRTSGFVRDLRKAHKSIKKDFYRNEAMALQGVRQAIQKKISLTEKGASPALIEKSKRNLAAARAGLDIARRRPGRLEERRGLLAQRAKGEAARAFLAREAKALIPLVLGVPAAALALVIRNGIQAFSAAGQFAAMGPQGGRFVQAQTGKLMDQMAFARRPDVSAVTAKTAELERANANLWREVGLQIQIVMNQVMESLGLSMSDYIAPPIKGDTGFVRGAVDERSRGQLKQRQAEIAAKEWSRKAYGPWFGGYD
jgi:hypothetical protein